MIFELFVAFLFWNNCVHTKLNCILVFANNVIFSRQRLVSFVSSTFMACWYHSTNTNNVSKTRGYVNLWRRICWKSIRESVLLRGGGHNHKIHRHYILYNIVMYFLYYHLELRESNIPSKWVNRFALYQWVEQFALAPLVKHFAGATWVKRFTRSW